MRAAQQSEHRHPVLITLILSDTTYLQIVTGVLSGYQFTQSFLVSNMSQLRAEVAAHQVRRRASGLSDQETQTNHETPSSTPS